MSSVPYQQGLHRTVIKPPDRCPEGHPRTPDDGYLDQFIECTCATSRLVGWSGHHMFTCMICNGTIIDPLCQMRG
jgi:hypothetical protein